MPVAVMMELGAQWLVAFYDYISTHPELVINGFKEVDIVSALENDTVGPTHRGVCLDASDEDPFVDLDIHDDSD